ncbi:MAG: hypothetical protein ACREMQ_06535 [Longimicrobiales bacterium]
MPTPAVVLVDSMIVIEAVRTGCWNALTGRYRVATVEECASELRRGDTSLPGYIGVTDEMLSRAVVHPLPATVAAKFRLDYPDADGLDAGERDLMALATTHTDEFRLCSCDKAALVAAHALGLLDRVVSLEALAESVGLRPNPALRSQFTEARMRHWRTSLLLGGPI